MASKAPTPQIVEDPQLAIQKQQAERDKLLEIQKQASSETDQLARLFGARSIMSGGSLKAPVLGY